MGQRTQHTAAFKAQVALEAIQGRQTLTALASRYGVHPVLVAQWKGHALKLLPTVFAGRQSEAMEDASLEPLSRELRQLQAEMNALKGKLPKSTKSKRALIEPDHSMLSVARQCALLGLPRSSWYYQPVPPSGTTQALLERLEAQYTQTPSYGVRRLTTWLRSEGYQVNPKRVRRLLRLLGLKATTPEPPMSTPTRRE
jgi:putative transposase